MYGAHMSGEQLLARKCPCAIIELSGGKNVGAQKLGAQKSGAQMSMRICEGAKALHPKLCLFTILNPITKYVRENVLL
jgi:hypothetical protein